MREKFKGQFYSTENCEKLLKFVDDCNDYRIKTIVTLALQYGLRRGEICGLKWNNLIDNTLRINCSRTQAGNKIIDGETKSKSSDRTLTISKSTLELLHSVKNHQMLMRNSLKEEYVVSDYILTDDFGKPIRPNYATELFTKFLKRNNLPHIRLHDLRHTFLQSRKITTKNKTDSA